MGDEDGEDEVTLVPFRRVACTVLDCGPMHGFLWINSGASTRVGSMASKGKRINFIMISDLPI